MAASMKDPRTFFTAGTPAQFDFIFNKYEEALTLKAEQKKKKVADFIKLDRWYQVELPKKIKSRGKDAHLVHEELVQCMKWKLTRGKFSPRIKDLVQMNTPRLCITETKKAFRALLKKDDLSSGIQALCNLKGVGPAMASVMLTAADHEKCGFMADECLLAIPDVEGIDYTTKELLNFVDQLKTAANRLNSSGGSGWNAHKIEQCLWAHSILSETKKEVLDEMPSADECPLSENGTETKSEKNGDGETSMDSADSNLSANKENVTTNGNGTSEQPEDTNEDTNDSNTNDSNTNDSVESDNINKMEPAPQDENTNDSIATSTDDSNTNDSNTNDSMPADDSKSIPETNGNGKIRPLESEDDLTRDTLISELPEKESMEPATKKARVEESS